jgi:hypothetical protein
VTVTTPPAGDLITAFASSVCITSESFDSSPGTVVCVASRSQLDDDQLRPRPCHADLALHQGVQVDRRETEVGAADLRAIELQHLGHHPVEPFGIAIDIGREAPHFLHVQLARVAYQLAEPLDS